MKQVQESIIGEGKPWSWWERKGSSALMQAAALTGAQLAHLLCQGGR